MRSASERQTAGECVSLGGGGRELVPCRSLALPLRQEQVLRFIESQIPPPSVTEIRDHLGVSSLATVYKHLCALQRKRLADWTPHAQRTLKSNRVVPLSVAEAKTEELRKSTQTGLEYR